jgi:hypothetical protein
VPYETPLRKQLRELIISRIIANAMNFGDMDSDGNPRGKYILTEDALHRIVNEILDHLV